ncbi:MAG: DDE-type integrase/transposase/recombinase, partial [Candidatus Nitrosopolaris sp.]
ALPDNNSDMRMKRGMEILQSSGKSITENEDGIFSVPSQTQTSIVYEVRLFDTIWVCTCPDFETREIEACTHIHCVKFWIATNTYLQDKPKPKVLAEDTITCKRCASIRVIHYGKSAAGKQTLFCKDCNYRFIEDSLLKRVRFTHELITLTLDLYFSGLSLRKLARNINDHFDISVDFTTIYNWIKRYIPIISEYVNSLTPQLSDTWHADELFIKMHGGKTYKGKTNLAFLWNVMDRKTRFLLASKVSEARDINGAVAVFKEAINNAHGNEPEQVLTDSWKAYRQGINEAFKTVKPEHVAKCGIGKPHANNNSVERLNGTIRERTKVQRAWKKHKTPIAEGQRIHYNFVKPHLALEGQTPAQRAGVGIERKNKWLGILEKTHQNDI